MTREQTDWRFRMLFISEAGIGEKLLKTGGLFIADAYGEVENQKIRTFLSGGTAVGGLNVFTEIMAGKQVDLNADFIAFVIGASIIPLYLASARFFPRAWRVVRS